MQIKLFTIPIGSVNDYNEELNTFLRVNKIIELDKQLIQTPTGVYWCFFISYISTGNQDISSKDKIDYMKILDEKTFKIFSRLREIRKKMAAKEAVSAFMIFTDAELAEIAKLPEMTTNALKTIKGIGDKKAEKFGEMMIKMYKQEENEEDKSPDTKDSLF